MTTLAFWHGWGMSPAVWDNLIGELEKELPQETAFMPMPLPGYAGTALPTDAGTADWAGIMMEKLPGPLVLCGWSMGAIMALSAAHRYPKHVSRLILFGATPCFTERPDWNNSMPEKSGHRFREGIKTDPENTLRRFIAMFNRQDRQARPIIRQLASHQIPPVSVLNAGLDFLSATDLRPHVPEIRQKTLLVHGAFDPLMPFEAAYWLAQALPDARLHVLPGVAHAPFLSEPRQCARLIKQFLAD